MLKRKYKNVYYFLVPIKKELDNGKSIKYKISLDLCQANYQTLLLMIYLKFTAESVKDVKKEKN